MRIIDTYIRKQLVTMVLIALLALLGVDFFFALINEVRFIGTGNYNTANALLYLLLTAPRRIYVLFPWAALLGTLFALGQIAKNSELIAIEVTEVSRIRIAWSVIKGSLLLVLLIIILGEGLAPNTERYAQNLKTRSFSSGNVMYTNYGVWIRNNNEFIHIGAITNNRELEHVTKFAFDDKFKLREVIKAVKAVNHDNEWTLSNVIGTTIEPNATVAIQKGELKIDKLLNTDVLDTISEKHLERLSFLQLLRLIDIRSNSELSVDSYESALWSKLMYPLGIIVMIYLGIPFTFGPMRTTSIGLKIVVGLALSFSYYLINSVFLHLPVIIGIHPLVAAAIPALGFFCIGSMLFYKTTAR